MDLSILGNFQQLLGSAGRKATPYQSQTGKKFRLDLSISGNFQQLWVQLAEKLPSVAKQANFLDWQFPETYGSAGR